MQQQQQQRTKMDGSLIRRNVVIYLNEQCPIIAVHFIYHTVAELEKWMCISRDTPDLCMCTEKGRVRGEATIMGSQCLVAIRNSFGDPTLITLIDSIFADL